MRTQNLLTTVQKQMQCSDAIYMKVLREMLSQFIPICTGSCKNANMV